MDRNFVTVTRDHNRIITSSLAGMTQVVLTNRYTGAVIEQLMLPADALVPKSRTLADLAGARTALHKAVCLHYEEHGHLLPVPPHFVAQGEDDQQDAETAIANSAKDEETSAEPVVTPPVVAPAPGEAPKARSQTATKKHNNRTARVPVPSGLTVDARMLGLVTPAEEE